MTWRSHENLELIPNDYEKLLKVELEVEATELDVYCKECTLRNLDEKQ